MKQVKFRDWLTIAGFIFLAGVQMAMSGDTRRRVECCEVKIEKSGESINRLEGLIIRLETIVEYNEKRSSHE
jgi:hypothetical protein